MTAWSEPDANSQSVAVAGGLPVAVAERRGNWARVTASNGWFGWVDGSRLP
jgi:SH3-like domain-containing protein